MLTRPIVSLFRSLRKKNIRFYYTPPTPEENYKLLGERKYDFKSLQEFGKIQEQEFKKMQDITKIQEKEFKELIKQVTYQKNIIEKIYDNLQNIQLRSSFLQFFTLINVSINFLIIIFNS
jgi:CRISPR/Cas system CSM-associated protein Csm4 (group 5 of RAMP superfamily)